MKRDPRQLDLFEWAERRPSAIILSIIPGIARNMWRDLHRPIVYRQGELVQLRPRVTVERIRA